MKTKTAYDGFAFRISFPYCDCPEMRDTNAREEFAEGIREKLFKFLNNGGCRIPEMYKNFILHDDGFEIEYSCPFCEVYVPPRILREHVINYFSARRMDIGEMWVVVQPVDIDCLAVEPILN